MIEISTKIADSWIKKDNRYKTLYNKIINNQNYITKIGITTQQIREILGSQWQQKLLKTEYNVCEDLLLSLNPENTYLIGIREPKNDKYSKLFNTKLYHDNLENKIRKNPELLTINSLYWVPQTRIKKIYTPNIDIEDNAITRFHDHDNFVSYLSYDFDQEYKTCVNHEGLIVGLRTNSIGFKEDGYNRAKFKKIIMDEMKNIPYILLYSNSGIHLLIPFFKNRDEYGLKDTKLFANYKLHLIPPELRRYADKSQLKTNTLRVPGLPGFNGKKPSRIMHINYGDHEKYNQHIHELEELLFKIQHQDLKIDKKENLIDHVTIAYDYGDRVTCKCPVHQPDTKPSAYIFKNKSWLLHCSTCNTSYTINNDGEWIEKKGWR